MSRTSLVFFVLGIIVIVPAYGLLILRRAQLGILPTSRVGILPSTPAISLFAFAIVMIVAIWLGPGPGLVANLCASLVGAWFSSLTFSDLLAFSSWGGVVGLCLHQPYTGEIFNMLRRPVVAVPLASVVPVFLFSISQLAANTPSGGLQAADYFVTLWSNDFLLWVAAGLVIGGGIQLAFLNPAWRPALHADRVSVYSSSLRARLMLITMPLVVLSIVLSVFAVTSRAMTLARQQSLAEMQRSASNAGSSIAHFFITGQNLLATFAEDAGLANPELRQHSLEIDRQVVPFFQELLLVNAQGEIVEAVPTGIAGNELTPEENLVVQQAADFGISQVTHLTELPFNRKGLTLVQPVIPEDGVSPALFLLGRVSLDMNPEMSRALEALQWTRERGAGFILDDRGLVIAHPNSEFILRPWAITTQATQYEVNQGIAYDDVAEGERVLTYIWAVEGTNYRVVVQLPFSAVLETAAAIAGPLLVVQLVIGTILLFALPFFTTRIIKPLNTLAEAADRIALGNLRIPVDISGEDEVAQLGRAFEQMRQRLRARLNDLSLLLNIAQSVSAMLDLEQGVQPILEGALAETGASVARFILLRSGERAEQAFGVGENHTAYGELEQAFGKVLARRRERLVMQDVTQAKSAGAPTGSLNSLAVFPISIQDSLVAIFWVGTAEAEAFDDAKLNFLSTLAGQASILVQNARLFQAAEGGRRRLAAILSSTTDAILVIDGKSRILLTNPAARRLLSLDESVHGQLLTDVLMPQALSEALARPDDEPQPPTVEVPFEDRRTFYASIAPITGTEGGTLGKVVVLRDVTHFKELDEMKSEFVATVSHDLRAPLTFIRGYATMLMMVGELNDKQHDYLERILMGIDQMGALIGDLLNLRRIEAGVGIRQEPCQLGLIMVEAVDTMRARGTTKGITLRLEPTEGAPTVVGDRTLLRQVISNLVDNAIKYTPAGGQVNVGLDVNEDEAIIHIADTGIGIAPEDQVRLFEKFYRIKRRETGNIQGTGLGLALVKSIVERHGGRVWVESSLNEGSIFYVALPLPKEGDEVLDMEETA
ncbi:MAG: HAMP domain-containing protein [Anaerolineae bacterium]|nr:HAMP domain-containing protein [Anaerolineae bacterium]